MIEIPPDKRQLWPQSWKWLTLARDYLHGSGNADHMLHVSDFIVWALAGWDRSEFEREHRLDMNYRHNCRECKLELDPRHTWSDEQWQQARRERLEGK